MDFEAYMGSNYQLLPTQMAGETMHPMSSDILFQDGVLWGTGFASHMDSSFGNLSYPAAAVSLNPNSFSNNPYSGVCVAAPIPNGSYRIDSSLNLPSSSFGTDNSHSAAASLSPQFSTNNLNPGALVSNPYFEASMEKNAIISGYRSAAPFLDGSYMTNNSVNLPSSSLAANNLSACNSLCLDHKRQHKQLSIVSPMAQSMLQENQFTDPSMQFDGVGQVQKKPRLESNMDDVVFRYLIQQLLLSQSSKQFTSHELKLAASHYRVLNALQKGTLPSVPKVIEAHRQQLVTQQALANCQKQGPECQVPQTLSVNGSTCAARLMQYLHHRRIRPQQNSIAYWRKFVAEYFASEAKKRWCFSQYDYVGHGAFSHATLDSWNCDICGTKSGRGYEVSFEVLPRLCKVNSEGGIIDELLYLESPLESKLPLGCMMLHYTKAVQETVYNHSRVVHEGQLRVTFTKELQIMSWEFCAKHHEEFVPRRLIAPQVNQLIDTAQKYQDNIELNKSEGGRRNALQATNNRFATAGGQLAKTLETQIVNECGFSKQSVRFFQIADVVNSMKDLMTYSQQRNLGPIESLKRYAQGTKFAQKQMDEKALYQDAQAFSTAGTNYYSQSQRLLVTNANSDGISSKNGSSQEPNFGVQASRKIVDSRPWNSYPKLLSGNSTTSSTSMNVQPCPSWYGTAPPSASNSITQPANSAGSPSAISFNQGEENPRKYVFSSKAPQGPHPPMTPKFALTSGVKGRNEAMSRAGGGSQRKSASARAPSKPSSTRDPSWKFKGHIKIEADVPEEDGLPLLPGVKVKKEAFHS